MHKVRKRELKEILEYTIRLTCRVGDVICRSAHKKKRISYKGAVDLVTQFDRMSQDMIVSALMKQYPTHGILSEENVSRKTAAVCKWIVDPLDGTTNFAHGLPIWVLSIALEQEGHVVLGVVYDPTRKEMFYALKGDGAFLNKRRIHVSRVEKLDTALLATGFPYDIRKSSKNNLDHFNNFAVRAQAVRRLGSAALDLCYTACGRFDGYWEIKLSPWDQAAGSLILREAGGTVTDFQNKPFDIYGDEVLGTNGHIHRQMLKVLSKKRGKDR